MPSYRGTAGLFFPPHVVLLSPPPSAISRAGKSLPRRGSLLPDLRLVLGLPTELVGFCDSLLILLIAKELGSPKSWFLNVGPPSLCGLRFFDGLVLKANTARAVPEIPCRTKVFWWFFFLFPPDTVQRFWQAFFALFPWLGMSYTTIL